MRTTEAFVTSRPETYLTPAWGMAQGGAMPPQPLPTPGPVTRLGRLVQPSDANEHGTLFGGEAMRFMDEAAAVAAIRYARGLVLTAHVDAIDFRNPVPIGVFLEAIARVVAVGRTSMAVEVVLEAEDRRTAARTITTTGRFVLVAVDAEGRPREVR
ncbi:MAG: acyl-CoA thioesterase [Candidatus Limnocylindrales bacterium]|jgi:acyl-CoA hydrolase